MLLLGSVPASVLDHVVTRSARLRWIHSASAGVDRVTTSVVRERGLTRDERPRGLQPPDRRVRGDDVARDRATAAPAARAPARADVAAAARARAVGADDRHRRIREHRRRAGRPARALRMPHPRHPPPPGARRRGRVQRRAASGSTDLDEVLRASDIVVVAAPLTDETAGLIGAEQLAEMREDAWLINIARGRLIDEIALRRALQSGLDRRCRARRLQRGAARARLAAVRHAEPRSSRRTPAGRPTGSRSARSTCSSRTCARSVRASRCATSWTSRPATEPMQVTIVGLPGSGKTTVFNALTGGHAETGGFSGGRAAPNVSVVKVPDDRVDRLAALFVPKKTTYADVTYVDVAIPAGAAREGTVNPDVLAQIRNADALLHVARAFDDPTAPTPGRPVARRRRSRPGVHRRRPDRHREAPREAADPGPPWLPGRARAGAARAGGPRAHRAAPVRGQADPLLRPDRGRGASCCAATGS